MATVTASGIKEKLTDKLQAIHVVVSDFSDGCGQKFDLIVVSDQFKDKSLLERHRAVNNCLADEISRIHAITMKTYTSEQWQKISSS